MLGVLIDLIKCVVACDQLVREHLKWNQLYVAVCRAWYEIIIRWFETMRWLINHTHKLNNLRQLIMLHTQ